MNVHKYTYKTEFQNRGAGHVHGVLWLNMNVMENYCQLKSGELLTEKQLKKPSILNKLKTNGESVEKVRHNKPFKGIKKAFTKLRQGKPLEDDEKEIMVRFVDAMTTVSLCPAEVGEDVVKLAREVNTHKHTKTCKKMIELLCRFLYPKYPSLYTLISGPLTEEEKSAIEDMQDMEQEDNTSVEPKKSKGKDGKDAEKPRKETVKERCDKTLKKVRKVIDDKETMEEIMNMYPRSPDDTIEENTEGRRQRINELLKKADITELDYYAALKYNPRGYRVVQKRDIDEMMVNSYNPEWLRYWKGNMDIQVCEDFFGVITYVTEYFTKDETQTMKIIKEVLEQNPDDSTREKMKKIVNTFMKARQIGEAEGFYKLMPDLLLKNSNVSCQWSGEPSRQSEENDQSRRRCEDSK